jgi:ubiquinone/menaquinone biosynthesis C-methylase UbiE
MVTIEEIQKHRHSSPRGIKKDFKILKKNIRAISKTIKKYQKGKIKKKEFQALMRWDLARVVSSAASLANSSKVRITEQFDIWQHLKEDEAVKRLGTAKGYDIISKMYSDRSNMVVAAEGKKIIELIGKVRGKKILDAGCGSGRYSIQLAKKGAEVHGIDISKGMLRAARKNGKRLGIKYQIASMLRIPYSDNVFDVVISNLAIDHVNDYKKALSEMLRVCKPNGFIVISTMHPDLMAKKKLIVPFGQGKIKVGVVSYRRTKKEFTAALKRGVRNLKFYDLMVPKSAEKFNPVVYRGFAGKPFVLAMRFVKR